MYFKRHLFLTMSLDFAQGNAKRKHILKKCFV